MSGSSKPASGDGMLLMYLADELPAEDRAEVERRLSSDPALRVQLQQLQQAQEEAESALSRLDECLPLVTPKELVVQRTLRAMRQHQMALASRHASSPGRVPAAGLRWWHPLAVAAALFIGYLAWWGWQPMLTDGDRGAAGSTVAQGPDSGREQVALGPKQDDEPAADYLPPEEGNEQGLDQAEWHAVALAGDDGVPWNQIP